MTLLLRRSHQLLVSKRSHEYCRVGTGGNLGDVIVENRKKKTGLGISDLAQILMQVSQGLKYIHAQGLVHLDIKPGKTTPVLLSHLAFFLKRIWCSSISDIFVVFDLPVPVFWLFHAPGQTTAIVVSPSMDLVCGTVFLMN